MDRTRLTHVGADGTPRMVDVSGKSVTERVARAEAFVRLAPETIALLREGRTPKGDPLTVARLAGIMAAKKTSELIPLCHPIRLDGVQVDVSVEDTGVRVRTEARARDVTGVEMEALTAASVAALAVYDMVKAVERGAVIESARVTYKSGGRSGEWCAEERA